MTRNDLISRILALIIVSLMFVAVFVYGYVVHGQRPLAVNPPDGSAFLFSKMLIALVAMLLTLYALRSSFMRLRNLEMSLFAMFCMAASAMGVVATTYLSIFQPVYLNGMIQELGAVAVLTELCFAIALVPLVAATYLLHKKRLGAVLGVPGGLLGVGLCLAVFLITMEEISWGQHLFGWGTPEAFGGNIQGETNFHNFYTHRFELAFYTAASTAFIILPALWPIGRAGAFSGVDFYVPPAWFGLVFMPVSGLLYNEWNALPQEFLVFLGFTCAGIIAYRMREILDRTISCAMVGLVLVAQTLILLFASGLPEGYEVSEIRELYIAVAVLSYAEMLRRKTATDRVESKSEGRNLKPV